MKQITLCLAILALAGCGGGGGRGSSSNASYDQVVLADHPTAFWKLDETTGTSALDSSPSGWSGAYQGAIALAKPDSSGRRFTQFSGGFVQISTSNYDPFYATGAVSIEAWYQGDSSILSRPEVIFAKGTDANPHNDGSILLFARPAYQTFESNSSSIGAAAPSKASANEWHQVIIEFDSNAGKSQMFLDGGEIASTNTPFSLLKNSGGFAIGEQSLNGYNYTFSGYISDVSLYNYSLSPSQVSRHFMTGKPSHT